MSEMTTMIIGREGGRIVSTNLLAQWIDCGPAPMVIDVRDRDAFQRGHVPEAENVPVSNARELVRRVPSDGIAVLVCEDGTLSREVARTMAACGLRQVLYLDGGMKAWVLHLRRRAAAA